MKYLKIKNDGVLDIRLVALMGGTTKAKDKFKIGQFGTGLKYTLAYLFRNNLSFKVFSGENEIDITTVKENISGTDFEIICIGENRTSITTFMGSEWSAWMIIRELWCNALDEGGAERKVVYDTELIGSPDSTTFYIQISPEISEVIENWRAYFVNTENAIWENENYAIYHNDRNKFLKLYKNGVLIYQHSNTKSLFNYDIKNAEINELREFKGMLSYEIYNCLTSPNEDVITYFLNNVTEEHYEGCEMDYNWYSSFANIWKKTIGERSLSRYGDRGYYESAGIDMDFSRVIELPERVYKALTNDFEGIGAVAMSDDKTEFFEVSFPALREKIENAILLLIDSGYEVNSEIAIKYGIFREKSKKKGSSKHKKHIMFSEACIPLSECEVCSLIIEENEIVTSNLDNTRPNYAKHFIDLYTKTLLSSNQVPI